ncbi:MAG: hypothetical protein ACLQIB_47530 [Isosphaeraceae bacterium]
MLSQPRQREQLDSPWKEALEQKVLETQRSLSTRWQWKLRLVKGLYDRGLEPEQVRQLFRVLDWMLSLPPELEHSFRDELGRFEEERRMPYVTTIERLARQEGRAEGLQAGILALLETKFQRVGAKYKREVRALRDVERLEAPLRAATQAKTLDDVFSLLR